MHCRRGGGNAADGAADRQHEDVPDRPGRGPAGGRARSGRRRSGSTRGAARSCGRTASRWTCPTHADDGGDEAEIAGAYLIGPDGTPYRVGLVQGNEFSDHVMESQNYLYLAPSKLRTCALGPELVVGADFADVPGTIRIERGDDVVWEATLASGEEAMSHSLANLEHHHFKYEAHRRPGDVHVHFFGADHFSFRDRVRLEDGDVMVVAFEGFGRPLRNPVRIDRSPRRPWRSRCSDRRRSERRR